jgi:predicted CXXCH cytochrome family protein
MKPIRVALVLAVALAALGASAAFADGGPHGGYINPVTVGNSTFSSSTINTDACAGCHRVHESPAADRLLKTPTEFELCTSCHNGTGSVLDVLDGKKLSATVSSRPGGAATGGDLLAGGFDFQRGQATTSKHPLGATAAWGAGTAPPGSLAPFDTTSGTAASLDCTSCHNPHGSRNYRILNEQVGGIPGSPKNVSVLAFAPNTPTGTTAGFTKDEFGPGITSGTPSTKYTVAYYASNGLTDTGGFFGPDTQANIATRNAAVTPGDSKATGAALLCGACHTAYPSPNAMDGTYPLHRHTTEHMWNTFDSATPGMIDPAFSWTTTASAGPAAGTAVNSVPLRLASTDGGAPKPPTGTGAATPAANFTLPNTFGNQQNVTCLTCHNAHGSSAKMTGFAAPVQVNPANNTTPTGDTTLLVADNRAMCESCHQRATPWS